MDRRAITRLALPLPLEPLIFRALNAQGIDGRHERLVYAWEVAIQIAASSAWAMCRHANLRSKQLDEVMPKLARPMFGHWLELLRASRSLLATHATPLAPLLDGLETKLDARLERVADRIRALPKRNAKLGGGTIGALLDALPVYRNETRGHGEPDTEFRAESVDILAEGLLAFCELAPPTGNFRPVIVDRVTEAEGKRTAELAWMDGGQPLADARLVDEPIATGRPYLSSAHENAPFVPLFPVAAAHRSADGWTLGWLKQQVRVPTLSFESSVGGAFASAVPDDEYAAFLRVAPEAIEEEAASDIDPWRGLLVYEEEHASVFYGRDALTLEIISHLEQRGAAVLCGASGSGKSSLVRAGILPKVRERQKTMLREELVLTMVPGTSPMTALKAVFRDAFTGDAPAIARWSREVESAELVHLARGFGKHVTLFVDQLEEVATLCADYDERTRFLDAIVAFAGALDPNEASLITTVRADRIEGLLEHAGLRSLLQRALEPIGAVKKAELREIITLPLKGRRVPIEPALVERILNDVGDEPGALALVSQLLSVLWETRGRFGNELSIRGYDAVGGVSGVLGQRGDEAREAAGERVDRLLVRLARRSDDGIFTRRRVTALELADALSLRKHEVDTLLAPFVERRLLVSGEHIEVAHEALLRSWPHLKLLLERESEAIALRQEIERATTAGELWSDATSKLKRAEELLAAGQLQLGEKERDFLRNSRRSVLRARRFARAGVGLIVLLGVASLVLAFWAIRASYKAKDAEREAIETSRDAYASAATALSRSPQSRKNAPFAALRALGIDHELRQAPMNDRVAITTAAYAARRYGEHLVVESDRPIRHAAFRADGAEVALVGDEAMLRVVDLATDKVTATPLPEGALAAFWKTGTELVVVTTKAVEVRTDHGAKVVSRKEVSEGLASVTIGKKGRIVTKAPGDVHVLGPSGDAPNVKAALLLDDVEDSFLWWNDREDGFLGEAPFPNATHIFVARAIPDATVIATRHEVEARERGKAGWDKKRWSFDPHETIAAVEPQLALQRVLVAAGRTLYAVDARSGDAKTVLKTPFIIRAIAVGPGAEFALAGEDGRIRTWDGATGECIDELDGQSDDILSLTYGAHRLVSTSADHTATIWKLGAPGLVHLLRGVPSMAAAPVFTAAGDIGIVSQDAITTYDGKTGKPLRTIKSQDLARAVLYDDRVLGVSHNGSLVVWNGQSEVRIAAADVVLARDEPVALACREAECTVVDRDAHEVMKLPAASGAKIISPSGKHVALAGKDGSWTVFDVEAKAQRGTIPSDAPTPRAVFGGSTLVVAGKSSVGLHDPTGKLIAKLPGNLNDVSEDGAFVRTFENGFAYYFRTNTGQKRGAINVGPQLHALSPNGRSDAIFDVSDRIVTIWSTDGAGGLTKLRGHTGAITAVSWSSDGRFLATTGEDRTLRVYDVGEQTAVAVIELEETPAEIHLSRDATRVVTSDLSNRFVRLYDVSLDGSIALNCRVAASHPLYASVEAVCH